MAQVDSENSTAMPAGLAGSSAQSSRRNFLAQAAAAVAGGAAIGATLPLPGSAGASERVPDPIYAAIEAHKAARAAFEGAVRQHSVFERELSKDKRRSTIDVWEETIVETDDPRWIDCERSVIRFMDAETEAACVLVNVLPTTVAGVLALLRYAVEADTDGEGWPPVLESDDGQTRSWRHLLLANLAEILPELTGGAA